MAKHDVKPAKPYLRRQQSRPQINIFCEVPKNNLKGQCHEKSFQTETVGV